MVETNSMIHTMLASIGIVTCCGIFVLFAIYVVSTLYWKFKLYELKQKQKHRFDKPPVAACYCRDCDKWDLETGECKFLNGRRVKDDWFCKCATRNTNPFEEEKRERKDRLNKYLKDKKNERLNRNKDHGNNNS